MELPIGVIDSGVGGASILKAIIKELPSENYVFVADTLNAPYGDKKSKKIIEYVLKIVNFLVVKRGIKMLVVACNTATAIAKESILKNYPSLPCVFVEPPIKTAIDSGKKRILVLATKRTLKSNKTLKYYSLIARTRGIKVKKMFIKELATYIDNFYENEPQKIDYLLKKNIKNKGYDAIVLGCTHYNFVKSNIKKILPKAEIISCEKSVARRTKYILNRLEGESKIYYKTIKNYSNVELILTGQNASVLARLTSMFPGAVTAHEE